MSRGMLQGTCLGEALRLRDQLLDQDTSSDDAVDEFSGPDGNGEPSSDLDIEDSGDDNDGSPGPVDGPSVLSEVLLAHKKGSSTTLLPRAQSLIPQLNPATKYPCASFEALGKHIGQVDLDDLVRQFLFYQQHPTFPGTPPLTLCPTTETATNISVFHSATAVFCAPSDLSGVGGLYRETIRCSPRWQTGGIVAHRRDCIILNTGSDEPGMCGLDIARVHLFFSFKVGDEVFSCALVHQFRKPFDGPDPDTGMWIVEPELDGRYRVMSVVHVDLVVRAAHLLPIFGGNAPVPREINFSHTLDIYLAFYVNKYIDYHAFETVF